MSMLKRVGVLFIAGLVTVACVSGSAGQRGQRRGPHGRRWGSEGMPGAGVCLFADKNFRGEYFCVGVNDDQRALPGDMRDKVSSLRVIGRVDVLVFRDERFRGPSGRFLSDARDLKKEGWNDQVSSIRVMNTASVWDGGRFPAGGRESQPREGACFYRDPGYNGDYFCVPRGGSYAEVPPGFNDKISSIRVIRAGRVLIFRDRDFEGQAAALTSDVPDLRRGVWNDRISSIRVF